MKKFAIFYLLVIFLSNLSAQPKEFEQPRKFTTELLFGVRAPMGVTRSDILSGFSLRAGVGYQLNKNWEVLHLSFDFGNSSPHDPDWVTFYDYYTYSA